LLKADEISGPDDDYKTAYLCCRHSGCAHYGIQRVRYSWPLPPLYYQQPNFWCHTEELSGAPGSIPDGVYILDKDASAENDGAPPVKTAIFDDQRGPILVEKGNPTMTQKSPQLMHQLSQREKMVYQLYAAARTETPLKIEYSVPVGHEFLFGEAPDHFDPILDKDPRLFRIDVVETYEDHIFIIEVKTKADLKAYGQVQAYIMLYAMHYKPKVATVPLLVFEEASQITLGVCLADEIPIYPVTIDTALKTTEGQPPLP